MDVTLTLTTEQAAAVAWEAARYGVTPSTRLAQLLGPALTDAVRQYRDHQWQARRRVLENRADLAAQVDAVVEGR